LACAVMGSFEVLPAACAPEFVFPCARVTEGPARNISNKGKATDLRRHCKTVTIGIASSETKSPEERKSSLTRASQPRNQAMFDGWRAPGSGF